MKKLWSSFEPCDNPFKRVRGLMFRNSFQHPLLFEFGTEGRHSIHSNFCPEFDAIFLDKNKRVNFIAKRVKPFTQLVTPTRPALFLIEAPAGDAHRKALRVGSELEWKHGGSIRLLKRSTRYARPRSRNKSKR